MVSRKSFTVAEAESLLPRLAPVLAALRSKKRELEILQEALREGKRKVAGNGHLDETAAERHEAASRLAEEIKQLVSEVEALGCELKDIDMGLVDFRAIRQGREVYLCWRLGEPGIAFWHELEAGYIGRQPLL